MAFISNPKKCGFWPQPGDVLEGIQETEGEPQKRENETLNWMKEHTQRESEGEPFFGIATLQEDIRNGKFGKLSRDRDGILTAGKPMPNVRTVFPDIDPERNKAKLDSQKAQAAEIAERYK